LRLDRRKTLDRKKNPFFQHAEMEMFLAERDGKVVGRVAAITNDNHVREHNEKVGFFGFFECLEDQEAATALLGAASAWVKGKGLDAIRGPVSPSVNDLYGLLTGGFDLPPTILMPYNPPYYRTLIENAGFASIKELYAYLVEKEKVFTEKLVRMSEVVKQRTGVTFRPIDMKNFQKEVETIHHLYTRGWEANWGEVPMTDAEFDFLAKDLKPVVDPRTVIIAEINGKAVGFSLCLPDLNMVLKDNRRGYLLPGLLRVLLFKKRIDFVRIIVLGVLPEYRSTGIGGVLLYETGRRGVEAGYPKGEASWVLEDNVMMNRGAELMNADLWKRYRIFQKSL
jgi:GNAT superfamily N-acetyltransferase